MDRISDASTGVDSQDSSSSTSAYSGATIAEVPQPRSWSRVPASARALIQHKDKVPDIEYDKTTLSKINDEVHAHTTTPVQHAPWKRPSPARYAPWTGPALTPYTGALVLSYYVTSEPATIYLRNGALFTISLDPPKTDLSHALSPDLERISVDADQHCSFTTRRLLNIIDIFSHVHSTTLSSIGCGLDPSPSESKSWSEEELCSLDIIAGLTCRLLAHPMLTFLDLRPTIEHYTLVVKKRIPVVVLWATTICKWHTGTGSSLGELGTTCIVEEKLGDSMKMYEMED